MFRLPFCLAVIIVTLAGCVSESGSDSEPAAANGAVKIYRDPTTGEWLPPPDEEARRVVVPVVSPTAAPFTIRSGTSPAGGVILDLGGSLTADLTVTHDGSGTRPACRMSGDTHAAR